MKRVYALNVIDLTGDDHIEVRHAKKYKKTEIIDLTIDISEQVMNIEDKIDSEDETDSE